MSASVMSPTPALPEMRKTSMWGKMFGGLKAANKRDEELYAPSEPTYDSASFPAERIRNMSTSTGVDSLTVRAYKRNASVATKASSAAPSVRSVHSRAGSVSSTYSRRSSSSRAGKWWRSSNPENAPPVPSIDNKFFGSHNPDVDSVTPAQAPVAPRRTSYTPRNAAGAFLKSTTTKAMQKTTTTQEDLDEASRRLSASSTSASFSTQATLVPEHRKDSHVGIEKHAMFSMAGVCDIIEEQPAEDVCAVSPISHIAKVDTPRQSVERSDSANGSPELQAVKIEAQQEFSSLATVVV